MNIDRLNEFVVLATNLNYSKSANQLFLTQPALSRHINDLEQTLGVKLFNRDTHNVSLTAAGEVFYTEAKEIITRYYSAVSRAREADSNTTGKLSIGFLGAAIGPFLSKFTVQFIAKHPEISLTFDNNDLDPLIAHLISDEIDICFVTHVDSNHYPGLCSETVFRDRLFLAVHPDSKFASRQDVSLSELSEVPMIAFDPRQNPVTNDFHRQMFRRANAIYNCQHEVPNIETALFFVNIGKGCFILPKHLSSMAGGCVLVPFADEECSIDLNFLWKKNNPNPAIPIFTTEFSDFMNENEL